MNDTKMEKAFINPTPARSPPHPSTPGVWPQEQITQQLNKARSLLAVSAAHPASQLAQPCPGPPPHAVLGYHTRGHHEPAAFLSEIKPFPEGTALRQALPASQTNSVLLER